MGGKTGFCQTRQVKVPSALFSATWTLSSKKSCESNAVTRPHTNIHHLHIGGERNRTWREEKYITMMQALQLLWLEKRHILGWSDVKLWSLSIVLDTVELYLREASIIPMDHRLNQKACPQPTDKHTGVLWQFVNHKKQLTFCLKRSQIQSSTTLWWANIINFWPPSSLSMMYSLWITWYLTKKVKMVTWFQTILYVQFLHITEEVDYAVFCSVRGKVWLIQLDRYHRKTKGRRKFLNEENIFPSIAVLPDSVIQFGGA